MENNVKRLEDIIEELIGYIMEVQNDSEDTYNTLKLIAGMTDEEIERFAPDLDEDEDED